MIDVTEVTRKLIGPVTPTGEHGIDQKRLANLEEMIKVANALLTDIDEAAFDTLTGACHKDSQEMSVKAIGERASKAYDDWGIKE